MSTSGKEEEGVTTKRHRKKETQIFQLLFCHFYQNANWNRSETICSVKCALNDISFSFSLTPLSYGIIFYAISILRSGRGVPLYICDRNPGVANVIVRWNITNVRANEK